MVRGVGIDKLGLKPPSEKKRRKNVKFANNTKDGETEGSPQPKRRRTTIWDAVAGRVGPNGWLDPEPVYSKRRDTASSSTRPISAEDVYYSRKNTGERPERRDDDDLAEDELPPSELTNALHRYVSRWMARPEIQRKYLHKKSFDFSAMLAFGILLDETIEESIEETGHLAFAEGEAEDGSVDAPSFFWNGKKWVRSVLEIPKKKRREPRGQDQDDGDLSEVSLDANGNYKSESESEEEVESEPELVEESEVKAKKPRQRKLKKKPASWQEVQARIKATEEALRQDREKKRKAEEREKSGQDAHYSSRSASPAKRARTNFLKSTSSRAEVLDDLDQTSESDFELEDTSKAKRSNSLPTSTKKSTKGKEAMAFPIRERDEKPKTKRVILSEKFVSMESSSDSDHIENEEFESKEEDSSHQSGSDEASEEGEDESEEELEGLDDSPETSEDEEMESD